MKYSSPTNVQAYYAQVWQLVRQIPAGKVTTYGQIARLIPPPQGVEFNTYQAFGPRWVGGAMAACPDDVPWQRVVNSQGKLSLRPGGGQGHQKELLESEGIAFNQSGKIDLQKFGWKGPGQE